MKLAGLLVLGAAALAVAGCNPQQQADASSASHKAQQGLGKAKIQAEKAFGGSAVTLKVKAALGASDKVNTSQVHVQTKGNVVVLTGAVTDAQQKALAGRIASDTVGPDTRVQNELQVRR